MKLVNFQCNNSECRFEEEDLYQDTEIIPKFLKHHCPLCGGILYKFNMKNNPQVWQFYDKRP